MRFIVASLFLAACSSSDGPDTSTDNSSEPPVTTPTDSGEAEDTGVVERLPPVYSQGSCPTLTDGMEFSHEFGTHDVRIVLPPTPEGAPVLFAWHWLGGSARDIIRSMALDDLAEQEGVIIIAPNSAGSPYEWELTTPPERNPDLALFRDLLACLHEQFAVDLNRVWTTGMSAGGLWTTYLTMHESQWLAASAPLSGGTFPGTYVTPDDLVPVMVTWGGPTDWYGRSVNFEETSLDFSENLQSDGHFVVDCVHDRGHTLPPGATELVWTFISAHAKDIPSPWAAGLPPEMPEWCQIP
jgi:dienelactone hydrolase